MRKTPKPKLTRAPAVRRQCPHPGCKLMISTCGFGWNSHARKHERMSRRYGPPIPFPESNLPTLFEDPQTVEEYRSNADHFWAEFQEKQAEIHRAGESSTPEMASEAETLYRHFCAANHLAIKFARKSPTGSTIAA